MNKSKTLLQVPELIKAIEPLVDSAVTPKDIFRLIGEGDIAPLGYLQKMPLFSVEQIGFIVRKLAELAAKGGGGDEY